MATQKDYSQINITDYTRQQLEIQLPRLARTANSRLRTLRAQPKFSGALRRANQNLNNRNLKYFPTSVKALTPKQQRDLGREILEFLNSKTSTVSGIVEVENNAIQAFRDKGLTIADPESWWEFLGSDTYKDLTSIYDSNQIQEMLDADLSEGVSVSRIQDAYEAFLLSNLTLEEEEALKFNQNLFK